MNEKEAWEVFDGSMLGDGGLKRRGALACFYIDLSAGSLGLWGNASWNGRESRIPKMQYLWYLRDYLELLGIRFSEHWPRARICFSRGRPYLDCKLESSPSSHLLAQFGRWYRPITDEVREVRWFPANQGWYKILPDDIELTPLTTAVWFGDDGNTRWNPHPSVQLRIGTNSFSKDEVERLSGLLLPFGVQARVGRNPTKRQMTWILSVCAADSVNAFNGLIEKHVHSCYSYKMKRARYVSEIKTEAQFSSLRSRLSGVSGENSCVKP